MILEVRVYEIGILLFLAIIETVGFDRLNDGMGSYIKDD